MTQKGHMVIRRRRDLLYDPKYQVGFFWLVYYPKGHGYLFGRYDLVYDHKRSLAGIKTQLYWSMKNCAGKCQ